MAPPLASTVADLGGLIAACATVGLLIAAVIAGRIARDQVIGLRQQLTLQQRLQSQRRVYDHIERLFDRDFVLMLSTAEDLFIEKPESPGGWEALWTARDSQQQAEVLAAMNFFEIVAGEYNDSSGILDRAVADKGLRFIADGMWTKAKPFVLWLRGSDPAPRAFEEWQRMYDQPSNTPVAPPP
jgi:hypothetical protein